ncbi:MAG: sigma-70 family RNA polymerase sigma factor [Myxococcaceae bacterium]|nr:sigma-70 family RNA polymerase sigma factor [Myxococcaceae bacterium]
MSDALSAGRAAWPRVELSAEAFAAFAKGRELQHPADLYLVCACVQRERNALSALRDVVLPEVVARARVPVDQRDELLAMVLERLLVAKPGETPRIAQYRGDGPLQAWLRMIVSRAAIDLSRVRAPQTGIEGHDLPAARGDDPELQLLRERHAKQLSDAFRAVLEGLPAREANVLQLHFLEGLGAAAIGAMYQVHARTVQRWIFDARESIVEQVHRRLQAELGLTPSQLDSLLNELKSRVDVSIARLLPRK